MPARLTVFLLPTHPRILTGFNGGSNPTKEQIDGLDTDIVVLPWNKFGIGGNSPVGRD